MGSCLSTVISPVCFCYKRILCNGRCCYSDYTPFNVNAARFSLLSYKNGDRFVFFPDGNGRLHLVDLFGEEPSSDVYYSGNDVDFLLFTRKNAQKPQQLFIGDTESLEKSNLDVDKPVIIVIHGWRSSADAIVNMMVKEGSLRSADVNIIFYVWTVLADGWYTSANKKTPRAGEMLGTFIDFLAVSGVSYSKIHLIGFSVGAHVAGFAGRNVKYGKVMRITALDPSLPGWYDREDRLSRDDAVYLEVLHTNAGYLGIKEAIGHADFFINGGTCQPGKTALNISYSHSRSVKIFAETIGNEDFIGEQCGTSQEAIEGRYSGNGRLVMGGISPYKIGSGVYYIETNSDSPFAKT